MQYHSTECKERNNEFARVFYLALQEHNELLVLAPDGIDSLSRPLETALGAQLAKKLQKDRAIELEGKSIFLTSSKAKKTNFKMGAILMPWASSSEWHSVVTDPRGLNTFFIPWTCPDNCPAGAKDELAMYLMAYPNSQRI